MSVSRVVVINDASQARGGATGLALLSARLLRERGLDVTYICGDDGANDDLVALGVNVVALGSAGLTQRGRADALVRGVHNASAREFVARYIQEHDTPNTVYHVHGWAQIFSPSIFRALGAVAGRTFIHAHDMFLACPNGVYMDYRRNQVCQRRPLSAGCIVTNCDKRSYAQKIWRLARQTSLFKSFDQALPWAGIVLIHPAMQERLGRAGYRDDVFKVVRNPSTPYSDSRIRAEDNRGIVFVGRLEPDKGAMDVADAAARAGMSLTLVGEGSLRGTLEEKYPDFRITGWQPREAVGAFVGSARVLVMPSHHPEPFALVIPEAVQSGLPVIVSETALMSGEITQFRLGVSVDVFDAAALDGAVESIRDMSADDLREMSERGFAGQGQLSLTPGQWVDQLLDLYQSVSGE